MVSLRGREGVVDDGVVENGLACSSISELEGSVSNEDLRKS